MTTLVEYYERFAHRHPYLWAALGLGYFLFAFLFFTWGESGWFQLDWFVYGLVVAFLFPLTGWLFQHLPFEVDGRGIYGRLASLGLVLVLVAVFFMFSESFKSDMGSVIAGYILGVLPIIAFSIRKSRNDMSSSSLTTD